MRRRMQCKKPAPRQHELLTLHELFFYLFKENSHQPVNGILIISAHCFTCRMHSENRNTNIHCTDWKICRKQRSKCESAGNIGTIQEYLAGNIVPAAQGLSNGNRLRIACIRLRACTLGCSACATSREKKNAFPKSARYCSVVKH